MRMSRAFFTTLRDAPSDAELVGHRLLLRAGFIQPLGAGIYAYLPLARRSLDKIEVMVRHEMNAIDGQELTLPLAMAHEEVVTDLARRQISSHRQLPQLIYHLQAQFRDEPRARGGLLGAREATTAASYSLDADAEGLERHYNGHRQAYCNIFRRCGVEVIAVEADGAMALPPALRSGVGAGAGGGLAHQLMVLSEAGEETLILCDACGYAANRRIAAFHKPEPAAEAPLPAQKVATPHCKTIAELAAFLAVPASRTAKAVFYVAEGSEGKEGKEGQAATAPLGSLEFPQPRFIFAVVRGDMEVNETKLANAVGATALRPATEEEIRGVGAQPGYGSPVGVHGALVVVDELAARSANLVAGANEEGYHLLNVNCGRDYTPDVVADITAARAGDACVRCGAPLHVATGVEVGNLVKLGTRYAEAVGLLYHAEDGRRIPIIMGSYSIGVGRLLAVIAETHHDDQGLIWPVSVAPFQVHLVVLPRKAPEAVVAADRLYSELWAAGIEVLYDDREDPSPGVKFNDADLIGLPLRITVGARSLQEGGVELKRRNQGEKRLVPLDQVLATVQGELAALHAAIDARVMLMPYSG